MARGHAHMERPVVAETTVSLRLFLLFFCNHPIVATFAHNPQFGASFSVGNAQLDADGKATVIAAVNSESKSSSNFHSSFQVLQKYRRELRSVGLDSLAIGFR